MVQHEVLAKLGSHPELKVHVVWTPVMQTDDYDAGIGARSHVPDARATHYWDDDRSLGVAYTEFVELREGNDTLAWDIYFVYEPGSEWGASPPTPADWWHQLAFDDRYLANGDGLREGLIRLLKNGT